MKYILSFAFAVVCTLSFQSAQAALPASHKACQAIVEKAAEAAASEEIDTDELDALPAELEEPGIYSVTVHTREAHPFHLVYRITVKHTPRGCRVLEVELEDMAS